MRNVGFPLRIAAGSNVAHDTNFESVNQWWWDTLKSEFQYNLEKISPQEGGADEES